MSHRTVTVIIGLINLRSIKHGHIFELDKHKLETIIN